MPKNELAITIICVFCLFLLLIALASHSFPERQQVTTKGVIAYAEGLTVDKTWIDWGNVTAGENKTETVCVINTGTQSVKLNVTVANWMPVALAEYMTVAWNYTGEGIGRNEAATVAFKLSVPDTPDFIEYVRSNNVTAFSFDIILEAISI